MSENEIKPVAWRCIWNRAGKSAWEQYHDESDPMPPQWDVRPNEVRALYDQSAIDRLREDLAEIRSQRDRAELLVEARGTCIASVTAERDAAMADAERYRWLRDNCQEVADYYATTGQLYFGTYGYSGIDAAIDAARAEGRA